MSAETPTAWRQLTLGDVIAPTHRPVEVRPDQEYPLLGVRWYCDGPRHHGTHSGKSLKTSILHRVQRGEITYNKMWVKKAAFAVLGEEHDGLYATSEYPTFAPDRKQLDLAFFGKLVQTKRFQEVAAASCKGTTSRARLNPGDFLKLNVVLPPLPEQKKIAEILGSVDDAIRTTEAVIEQTRRVKEGLLQELLTKGIGHTMFKQTELGAIPQGWAVSSVGAACRIHNSPRKPIKVEDRKAMPGPYPYWGPTKILDFINEYNFDGEYALIGEDGDHFLKWDRWEMTKWATGRFNVNNHAHVIGSTNKCTARWFFYYFLHRDLTQGLTRQGANRYKLTKAGLSDLSIVLPPLNEQVAIAHAMDGVVSPLAASLATLDQLRRAKGGLLQDLLTGSVRVKT